MPRKTPKCKSKKALPPIVLDGDKIKEMFLSIDMTCPTCGDKEHTTATVVHGESRVMCGKCAGGAIEKLFEDIQAGRPVDWSAPLPGVSVRKMTIPPGIVKEG